MSVLYVSLFLKDDKSLKKINKLSLHNTKFIIVALKVKRLLASL